MASTPHRGTQDQTFDGPTLTLHAIDRVGAPRSQRATQIHGDAICMQHAKVVSPCKCSLLSACHSIGLCILLSRQVEHHGVQVRQHGDEHAVIPLHGCMTQCSSDSHPPILQKLSHCSFNNLRYEQGSWCGAKSNSAMHGMFASVASQH